jgi:hypothetical protein
MVMAVVMVKIIVVSIRGDGDAKHDFRSALDQDRWNQVMQ